MTSSQTSLAVDNCLTGCLPGILKVGSIGILIYSSLGFLQYLFFSLLFIQLLTRRLSLLSPLNELPFRIYLKSIWDDFVCLLTLFKWGLGLCHVSRVYSIQGHLSAMNAGISAQCPHPPNLYLQWVEYNLTHITLANGPVEHLTHSGDEVLLLWL